MSLQEWDPATPWARQPCDDTDEKWCAFVRFLALPRPRDLRDIASSAGIAYARVDRWSRLGAWRQRAAALDERTDAQVDAILEGYAVQQANMEREQVPFEGQATLFRRARRLISLELEKHLAAAESTDAPTLTIGEVTKLAGVMLPQERVVAGGVSAAHKLDLGGVSDENLALIERLLTEPERLDDG